MISTIESVRAAFNYLKSKGKNNEKNLSDEYIENYIYLHHDIKYSTLPVKRYYK